MRTAIVAFASCLLCWPLPKAAAQPGCDGRFVGETIRFIVAHQPGGGYDIYARMIAPHYAEAMGAEAVVENWPGARDLIGADKIRSAAPDGLTFGLVNAPKILGSKLLGDANAVNLVADFHIFARVAQSRHVWVVSADSGITSAAQILTASPPKVFASTDLRGAGFLGTLLASELLDFDFDVVFGLGGTKNRVLALLRGDTDFMSSAYSSVRSDVESGDLKVLLQVASAPIADHEELKDVPLLGGRGGIAARLAEQRGTDVKRAADLAAAIESFIGSGRILVGPTGFDAGLADCIERALMSVLTGEALNKEAERMYRPLEVTDGKQTIESLKFTLAVLEDRIPLLRKKIRDLSQ